MLLIPRSAADGLVGLSSAARSLRGADCLGELITLIPRLIVDALAFDRAAIGEIEDGVWTPVSVHTRRDSPLADLPHRSEPALLGDHRGAAETEMARRRCAILVNRPEQPADGEPRRWCCEAYVAAPIVIGSDVVGVLHATRHHDGGALSTVDRDLLAAFAESVACALERVAMLERMRAHGRAVRTAAAALESSFDAVGDRRVSLSGETGVEPAGSPPPLRFLKHESGLCELLTRRELEVMQLMANGATNAAIAAQLVVSPGTVKSHVKSVLRKLHASNRAEAVSKYLRLTALSLRS